MGNLSEHFNNGDFACKCQKCKGKGEFRFHLGLIGALELIAVNFKKTPHIILGYRCEDECERLGISRKNYHALGKAANFRIDGIAPAEIYKFALSIEELHGIGLNIADNFVHVDTRKTVREEWVKDFDKYLPMTPDRKIKYLG